MDNKDKPAEGQKQEENDQTKKPLKTAPNLLTETNLKQPQQSSGFNTPNNETSSQNDTVDLESYLNTSGLSIDSTDLLNSVQDVFSKSGNGLFGQSNADFCTEKDEHLEFHHGKSSQHVVSGYSGSVINNSPHNSQDLLLDGILKTVAFKEQKNISTEATNKKLSSDCCEITELQITDNVEKSNLNLCTSTPVQARAHKILSGKTESFLQDKGKEFVIDRLTESEITSFQKSVMNNETSSKVSKIITKTDHLASTSHSPLVVFHSDSHLTTAKNSKAKNIEYPNKGSTDKSYINKVILSSNSSTNSVISKSSTKQTPKTVEAAISLLSLQNLQTQKAKLETSSPKTALVLQKNEDKNNLKHTTTESQLKKSDAKNLSSSDGIVTFKVVTMSPKQGASKVTTNNSGSTLSSVSQCKVITNSSFKDSDVKVVPKPINVNLKGKQQTLLKLPLVAQTKKKILTFPGIKLCKSVKGSTNRKIIKVEYQTNQVSTTNALKIQPASKNNFCTPFGNSPKISTTNNFKIFKTEKKNFVPFGSMPPKKPIDIQKTSSLFTNGSQIKSFKNKVSLPIINNQSNNAITHFPGIVTASNKLIIGNKTCKLKEKPSKMIDTFKVGAPTVVQLPKNCLPGNLKIKKEPGTYNSKNAHNSYFDYSWTTKNIKEEFSSISSKPLPFKDAFGELTNLDWLFENSKTVNAMLKKCNPDAESKCKEDLKEKIMDQYNNNLLSQFSKVWGREYYDVNSRYSAHDNYDSKKTKPPYSFSLLIFMAVEDSFEKKLPVKKIYEWVLRHFPYFKTKKPGWKNSIRHNLSLGRSFMKAELPKNSVKGALWCINPAYRMNMVASLKRSPFYPYLHPEKYESDELLNDLVNLLPGAKIKNEKLLAKIQTEKQEDIETTQNAAHILMSFGGLAQQSREKSENDNTFGRLSSTETSSSSGFNQQLVISNHPVNEEHTYSSPHAGSHQIKRDKLVPKKLNKKEKLMKKKRKSNHKQKTELKAIATPQESLEVVNDYDMPEVGMEEEILCVNADQSDTDSDEMLSDNDGEDLFSSDTDDASEGNSDDEVCDDSRGVSGNRLFDSGYASMKGFRMSSQKNKQSYVHKKHQNKREIESKRSYKVETDTDVSSEPEIQKKISSKKKVVKKQNRKRSAIEKQIFSENKTERRSSSRIKSPSKRMQESMKQTKKKIKTDRKISKKLEFQKPKTQQKIKSKKQVGTKRKLKASKNAEASMSIPIKKKRRKEKKESKKKKTQKRKTEAESSRAQNESSQKSFEGRRRTRSVRSVSVDDGEFKIDEEKIVDVDDPNYGAQLLISLRK